jgi:RecB family endonuclease NucS
VRVRLIVARCSVDYTGRLTTHLPEAVRLLMIKADGGISIWHDGGSSVKPQNWMTPPTVIETEGEPLELMVVRKHAGGTEDRLDNGVEAHLQELLAEQPHWCGEGFRLVRREWPTDIGPVDLMCRDDQDGWIAVEIKRVATIDAVEQLTRYLERLREDPAMADCQGVLAAQQIKPQARVLAESRGAARRARARAHAVHGLSRRAGA